jgi:hypothetical protein
VFEIANSKLEGGPALRLRPQAHPEICLEWGSLPAAHAPLDEPRKHALECRGLIHEHRLDMREIPGVDGLR